MEISRDHHPDVEALLDLPSPKHPSVLLGAPEEKRGSDRPALPLFILTVEDGPQLPIM